MVTYKTKIAKIPVDHYKSVKKIGDGFNVPTTKAFIIRDKLLFGDFKAQKIKQKGKKKEVFKIEFDI